VKKAGIKTIISPQISCHTTLQKVSVQLCKFTFMLERIICFMSAGWHLFCEFLFIYFYYSPDGE